MEDAYLLIYFSLTDRPTALLSLAISDKKRVRNCMKDSIFFLYKSREQKKKYSPTYFPRTASKESDSRDRNRFSLSQNARKITERNNFTFRWLQLEMQKST